MLQFFLVFYTDVRFSYLYNFKCLKCVFTSNFIYQHIGLMKNDADDV